MRKIPAQANASASACAGGPPPGDAGYHRGGGSAIAGVTTLVNGSNDKLLVWPDPGADQSRDDLDPSTWPLNCDVRT